MCLGVQVRLFCHGDGTKGGSTTTCKGGGGIGIKCLVRCFGPCNALAHCGILVIGQVGGHVTLFVFGLGDFVVYIIVGTLCGAGVHTMFSNHLGL